MNAFACSACSADGATGAAPSGCNALWDTRPTCQSWAKITPPSACTASVTVRQPSICAGGVDARRPGVTLATRLDLGALADHETGRGALTVILGHQLGGDIAGLRAALTRQRWQDDAVGQGVMPEFYRGT